jgi:hypothetical protein
MRFSRSACREQFTFVFQCGLLGGCGRQGGDRAGRGTGVAITGLSLALSPYFLSAFVTRFPNALSDRPISRFSSFKVLDLAPPFFLRTVVFIAISSSPDRGLSLLPICAPALQCGFRISYPFVRERKTLLGHWAVDGGVGYTYLNEKAGIEGSVVFGLTYNFINPYTQYQSGTDAHLDWALSPILTDKFHIGAQLVIFTTR